MNRIKVLFLSFSLFSCALFIPGLSEYNKAKKYYNNRSYDLAVEYSYSSLLRKIDNEKAIQLFELSFTSAVNSHNTALSSLFKIEDDSMFHRSRKVTSQGMPGQEVAQQRGCTGRHICSKKPVFCASSFGR